MSSKILIIGGGPAGLTAAIEGSKKGLNVTLCEKNEIGKNINCAEGYFDLLNINGPPSSGVQYKVKQLIIKSAKKYYINTENFNIWMIDRKTWQKDLLNKAVQQGVKIKEHHKISIKKFKELQNYYDYILDGSGVPSVTSLYYGFKNNYLPDALITVQYKIKGDFSNFKNTLKVYLLKDFPGYAWIFPKSKLIANIGMGIFNKNNKKIINGSQLYVHLNEFLNEHIIKGKIINKSAGICPSIILKPLRYKNIFLIGDAAGLTSPLHGGGLDLALISSKTAIKCIVQNKPQKYRELLNNTISSKIKLEKYLKNLWLSSNKNNFEQLLTLISNMTNKRKLLRFLINHESITELLLKKYFSLKL